jgi:GYF domain 2
MHYYVSRGGQTYGPYTLADLQRYVASGHILLSDLAKSDETAQWVPVDQILKAPAAADAPQLPDQETPVTPAAPVTPPAAAPYYPPTPAYTNANLYPDPPNLHWALVLLIDLFTCGLFQIIWNFVMAAWLKRVQPNSKAIIYYAVGYGLLLLSSGLSFPIYLAQLHHGHPHHNLGAGLLGIIAWVFRLLARFSFKDSLEEHFNGPEPMGYRMNSVLLFFFGGLYIQSELNRINEIKQSLRYREAAY